ncbi:skin secretory protein xP2-like [Perca fluviatilis]|uniref:skin secretory protein xP2-like n=1 Tax=Perca fluviatilis TaxID=8168 RepID=UPI0019652653|nr:skin secretory protein xP2-like [Perca fluviatilis]
MPLMMSNKPKSHKSMGEGEWMARLRAYASSGVWPSGGNRPAPKQRKWHDLYQKIEKCPMQARGQTTLFGGSVACNCGFHGAKPTTQPPAAASQSAALVSTPGATAAVPPSFWRPPPSLSMFTKSRFGGSQSATLKPNLVARRSPSPSSSPVRTPSPSPSSVRTPSPSPSSGRTPSHAPSSGRTPSPSPSSVRTPSHAPSSGRTPSPSPSSVRTPSHAPSSGRTPSPSPSSVRTPSHAVNTSMAEACDEPGGVQLASAGAACSFWLPAEMRKNIPIQDQRWISNAIFHSGKLRQDLKLWYEPPVPALIYHQTPTPDRFFTHRLMVWMPYHLWKVRVNCPEGRS